MLIPKFHFSVTVFAAASAFALLSSAGTASADGGFLDPNNNVVADYGRKAAVEETVTVNLNGNGIDLTASTGADADGGHGSSSVTGWNTTTVTTTSGNTEIIENTTSLSTGFSKDGGSVTRSKTVSETTVIINGKTYAVVDEVAIAVARNTKFGSSAAVGVDASVSGGAGGATEVTVTKAMSR
jgi:hypothetical protein